MGALTVGYVVNAVGEGSIPADIATAVTTTTEHDVEMVTWFDTGEFAGSDVVPVHHLDAPSNTLGIDRTTYRRARSRLSTYDVVQAHHNHSGAFAKMIARRLDIPTVSREGNTRDGFTLKGRVANGVTNPLADRVVCISRSVFDSFRPWERLLLSADDVEIIPNGVDPDRIANASGEDVLRSRRSHDDAFVVGNAAMLYEQKAHDVLIRAIAEVNERTDRPVELAIAGDGPRRDDLEALATAEGVDDLVHFLGYTSRENVYALLAQSDAFAMPSRWEGFCVAVAEAMAAGVPCVLSDIDVFAELYEEAAVFHPVDDVGALGARIDSLLADESRCEDLSERGTELVRRRYDIDVVAQQYAAVYEDIA